MRPGQVYMTDALSFTQKDVVGIAELFKQQGGWGSIPAVKLYEKNGLYYVIDGNHRVKAARCACLDSLEYDLLCESELRNIYPNYDPDNIEASAAE